MEDLPYDLDVILYDVKGDKVETIRIDHEATLVQIVLKYRNITQWSVDDTDENGVGANLIGTGVIPEEVIEKYGMDRIKIENGPGFHC